MNDVIPIIARSRPFPNLRSLRPDPRSHYFLHSSKYPLAILAKLCQIAILRYLLGFDIGCAFRVTLANSSLGPAFFASGSRVCVNAFHGYSHSYQCQVQHHPNVVKGMGIEDLETLERIFSASNQLAAVIRYASAYRRHALMTHFFRHWDDEKYANLGLMLYNNYRQAQEILKDKVPALEESLGMMKMPRAELDTLAREEQQYFATLKDEAPWDVHAVAYVQALQDLRSARYGIFFYLMAMLTLLPQKRSRRFVSTPPIDRPDKLPVAGADFRADEL